jgi:hypothetical protein
MLKLVNIKKTDEYIEANYIPEHTNELGYVKIEIKTKNVIQCQRTPSDEGLPWYFSHARDKLIKCIDLTEIPKEMPVVWY